MSVFKYRTRVYYDATDAGGVVYHSYYLNYIEHARMEYFLHHGFNFADMQSERQEAFVAVESNMKWLKPARVGDELEVTVEPLEASRVSLTFAHTILKIEPSGERTLLNSAEIKMVYVGLEPIKARTIPQQLIEKLMPGSDAAQQAA